MIETDRKTSVKSKFALNIILLGLVSMFVDMSTEMVYPIMPMFLLSVGAAPAIIGVIEGVTEGLATVLKAFAGYVADKTHRKKALAVVGYGSALLYKIGIIFSTSWVGVFIFKIIDRTGKGLRTAPRDSLIAESSVGGLGKNYGFHKTFDMLGSALGVLAAYIILFCDFPYKTVFIWSMLPAAVGVVLLLFVKEKVNKQNEIKAVEPLAVIDEATIEVSENKRKRLVFGVKLPKRLWAYLLFLFVFSLGNSSNAFLLLKAGNVGISETTVLLIYLLYNVSASLLAYPLGKLSDKIGRRKVISMAYLLYGAIYLGFGLITNSTAYIFLFGLYGIYTALISGAEKALAVEMSPNGLKGTVLGLQGMMQGAGLLISSITAGALWQLIGAEFPFIFGALMAIIAAIAMMAILKKPSDKQED